MSSTPFSVQLTTESGLQIVRALGEIDMNSSPSLRAELITLADRNPPKVVVDLSGVPHMDSSGVATLVEFKQRLDKGSGGHVVLTGLQPMVQGLFELAKLDRFFTIVTSVDKALNS